MVEMLTAREMEELLQVDRSTIYRMADAGKIPALKVGKQWRFPEEQIQTWLDIQAGTPAPATPTPDRRGRTGQNGATLSPLAQPSVQLIQDTFAEQWGVMMVVTDLEGRPLTAVSNPTTLYRLLAAGEDGHALCYRKWSDLGQAAALAPRFTPTFAGLLCARALVRLDGTLQAMVIAFGVADPNWHPVPAEVEALAASLAGDPAELQAALAEAPVLTSARQKELAQTLQRIADILAQIGEEQLVLLRRLAAIRQLSTQ